MNIKPIWILYGVGAGVALLALNKLLSGGVVSSAAGAVARLPGDVFRGGVEGLLGIPDTQTERAKRLCAESLARGEDGLFSDAAIYCPAFPYIRGWFDGK